MKENNSIVLLLEDEEKIIAPFEALFKEKCKGASIIVAKSLEEYTKIFEENKESVKCLVMDLNNSAGNPQESIKSTIAQIFEHFNTNRIPIFVHSGNLEYFTDLDEKGTVIKKEKSRKSIGEIVDSIYLMLQSGFLNIFSIKGSLEEKIMKEIHSAFINQFKHNEIEQIIKSVQASGCEESVLSKRTTEIFERIAIRVLYSNLMSARAKEGDEGIVEVKLNAIEHYYRRTSDFPFWTGDVFCNKENSEMCLVITPRCNLGHNNLDEILLCKIVNVDEQAKKEFLNPKKGLEVFRKSVTDDKRIGDRHRFLPPSPQFKGGFVDFKTVFSMHPDEFNNGSEYLLSLSDELTNDVVRKFSSYISRGGISETDFVESLFYVEN